MDCRNRIKRKRLLFQTHSREYHEERATRDRIDQRIKPEHICFPTLVMHHIRLTLDNVLQLSVFYFISSFANRCRVGKLWRVTVEGGEG